MQIKTPIRPEGLAEARKIANDELWQIREASFSHANPERGRAILAICNTAISVLSLARSREEVLLKYAAIKSQLKPLFTTVAEKETQHAKAA